MSKLAVRSETGRLRRVLLHEPGPEIDRMVPSLMEELLFDDILFGEDARDEHRRLRRVLQLLGIEPVEIQDLLTDVLAESDAREEARRRLETEVTSTSFEALREAGAERLAEVIVAGVRDHSADSTDPREFYDLLPLPNYCFQRDPMIVLGSRPIFCPMATPARRREAWASRFVALRHPLFAGAEPWWDPFAEAAPDAWLEGGDLLVLSPDVVAVGLSERTNRAGVEALIRALRGRSDAPRWLFAVEIPRKRAYMHLDTLITPVDRDACLAFAPVLRDDGAEAGPVYEIDLHGDGSFREVPALLSGLARRGVELEPISCGGDDPVLQRREQWTDGANAMALAPGVILTYDRNVGTVEELSRHGFRILTSEDLLLGREEVDLDRPTRTCIVLQSNELSRARGGPHCLLHPLERDPAD